MTTLPIRSLLFHFQSSSVHLNRRKAMALQRFWRNPLSAWSRVQRGISNKIEFNDTIKIGMNKLFRIWFLLVPQPSIWDFLHFAFQPFVGVGSQHTYKPNMFFYGILNSLGLPQKEARILFLDLNNNVCKTTPCSHAQRRGCYNICF